QDAGTDSGTSASHDDPDKRQCHAAALGRHYHDRLRLSMSTPTTPAKAPSNKFSADLVRVLPHLQLDANGKAKLADCKHSVEALDRLEEAGLLDEAARLVAHALPPREAVWWACACSRHTAQSGANPEAETAVRAAAEEWVRRQTDEVRRAAMAEAEKTGFSSPEAWGAGGALWSGGSMAAAPAPRLAPQPHFPGLAAAGSVAWAAVRGQPVRREARLKQFLVSARDIANGGAGRLEPEAD